MKSGQTSFYLLRIIGELKTQDIGEIGSSKRPTSTPWLEKEPASDGALFRILLARLAESQWLLVGIAMLMDIAPCIICYVYMNRICCVTSWRPVTMSGGEERTT